MLQLMIPAFPSNPGCAPALHRKKNRTDQKLAVRGCPGMKGGLCLLVLLLASTAALPVEDGVGEALPMGESSSRSESPVVHAIFDLNTCHRVWSTRPPSTCGAAKPAAHFEFAEMPLCHARRHGAGCLYSGVWLVHARGRRERPVHLWGHPTGAICLLLPRRRNLVCTCCQPAWRVHSRNLSLQHVANRFCTEFVKKSGTGPVFCEELVLLQHKWIDADTTGQKDGFTKVMGGLIGHYCPDAESTETARCLVLQLLSKAVPATLKWSLEKKSYYQMTKDVASHYCKKLGPNDVFCPLMEAVPKHFFHAVMAGKDTDFKSYMGKLNAHYCNGPALHVADKRCTIFQLMEASLPNIIPGTGNAMDDDNRHAEPKGTGGNVPSLDGMDP